MPAARPFALWVWGQLPFPGQESVSLVGARASTAYGNAVTTDLAYDLVSQGVCVVSGGAYGIDSAAHRGALRSAQHSRPSSGCPTVAILCGGLQNLYPAGNTTLFEQIVQAGGAVVAEMPPSFRPARWRFLERNRVIAAFSAMTVVVEAGIRSGAIASANRALELGKEVGAVPGPVTSPTSAGSNQLLAEGATVITKADDILEHLGGQVPSRDTQTLFEVARPPVKTWVSGSTAKLEEADPLERRTWDALPRKGAALADEAAAESGLSLAEINMGLNGLLSQGLAKCDEAGRWRRAA